MLSTLVGSGVRPAGLEDPAHRAPYPSVPEDVQPEPGFAAQPYSSTISSTEDAAVAAAVWSYAQEHGRMTQNGKDFLIGHCRAAFVSEGVQSAVGTIALGCLAFFPNDVSVLLVLSSFYTISQRYTVAAYLSRQILDITGGGGLGAAEAFSNLAVCMGAMVSRDHRRRTTQRLKQGPLSAAGLFRPSQITSAESSQHLSDLLERHVQSSISFHSS